MNNKAQGLKLTNKYSSQISAFLALIILCVVLSFLSKDFMTVGNLLTVTNQVVYIALMAIGMTVLFMLGAIDLSVGAILALSACVMACLRPETAREGYYRSPRPYRTERRPL